jgi:hypothetical protein
MRIPPHVLRRRFLAFRILQGFIFGVVGAALFTKGMGGFHPAAIAVGVSFVFIGAATVAASTRRLLE